MMRQGLLAPLIAALVACAAETGSADPKDPGAPSSQPSQMHGVTLTPTAPRQDLPVSPPAGSATLVLTLVAIDNPSSQAFSLAASLAATGGGQRDEPIGSVTPFPSTQPGSFVLTLPEPARKSAVRDGQLVLRLTLQPIAADRPLAEPLRVTVGAPAWR